MFPAAHTIGGGGIKIAPNPWADRTHVRLSDAEGMDGAATFNSPAGGPARWPLNGPRVAVCAVYDDSARNETPAAAAAAAGAASTAIDTDYDVFRPRRIRSDGKVQMPSRRRSIENRTARRRRRRRRRKVSAAEFTASRRKTADAIVCTRSGDGHRRATAPAGQRALSLPRPRRRRKSGRDVAAIRGHKGDQFTVGFTRR